MKTISQKNLDKHKRKGRDITLVKEGEKKIEPETPVQNNELTEVVKDVLDSQIENNEKVTSLIEKLLTAEKEPTQVTLELPSRKIVRLKVTPKRNSQGWADYYIIDVIEG